MRNRQLAAIVLFALLAVPACTTLFPQTPATVGSGQGPQTFVGQVAIYGRQFSVAGDGALTALDLLIGGGVLDRTTGVQILTVMKGMGDKAVQLAGILRVIDQTRTGLERASNIQKARAVIAGMTSLFDDALIPITDPRIRTIVGAALQTAKALVGDFSNTLATGAVTNLAAEADALELAGRDYQVKVTFALAQ